MEFLGLLKKENNSVTLPSIFVIDEAHALLYDVRIMYMESKTKYRWKMRDIDLSGNKSDENEVTRAPYNVFRRIFRMYTNTWETNTINNH